MRRHTRPGASVPVRAVTIAKAAPSPPVMNHLRASDTQPARVRRAVVASWAGSDPVPGAGPVIAEQDRVSPAASGWRKRSRCAEPVFFSGSGMSSSSGAARKSWAPSPSRRTEPPDSEPPCTGEPRPAHARRGGRAARGSPYPGGPRRAGGCAQAASSLNAAPALPRRRGCRRVRHTGACAASWPCRYQEAGGTGWAAPRPPRIGA
ncbi:hypothetical protein RVR_8758 [Actinacidiphila reveromycinica]|uniref:Uncharacterized protein n=1 Tax=Actinacidiphila reveromycinica TaxID=659352 RepID=A0A7U3UZ82_9ACTN|nr:hypothetical protein RVR_8758 [Streptomyces sp. SN-593]